jgi:hypothetical protein
MNKSEIASRINQPTEKIDAILKDAGLPTDVEQYSPEQAESLEAIAKMVETKQAKNFKDAGGLYRKIQNEAQLKEIAARYSMGDRISEISSALKLKPESITTEQFEQFRMVCEQVQQGMELPMVAQGVLNKAQAKPAVSGGKAQSGPESANQAVGTALAQRKDSAPTTNRTKPGLVEQSAAIEGVPLDGEAAAVWDNLSKAGAAVEAERLATAPFDGMIETAERIRQQAANLKQRGSNQFLGDFSEAFNDPALIERVKTQALGKLPPEWADRLNSKTKD